MKIPELLNYASDPGQKPILTPLLTEVGTLLLKLVYSMIDETDLDRARVLVYNAGIEADWLDILAEGNPAYIDHVIEQAYHDVNNELHVNLVCLEHDIIFGNLLSEQFEDSFKAQRKLWDQEGIDYIANMFAEGDLE